MTEEAKNTSEMNAEPLDAEDLENVGGGRRVRRHKPRKRKLQSADVLAVRASVSDDDGDDDDDEEEGEPEFEPGPAKLRKIDL